ncbi:MAG: Trk system potassium transporter TrkA [Candidatus Omnitrophica bacterium]|nr:Trk system potassium transporter TrkA [Candidatus Omnitrophota bacterium]
MRIVIVGAGMVGYSLAEYFSGLNHYITIIEKDKELCENINNKLDVFVVEGSGSSPAVLDEADIKSADLVIAVTPSDEINLLVCNFAMQNGVKKRIARVKSNIYTENTPNVSLEKLGVTSLIEPELEVMKRVLQYVELPDVIETANFQANDVYLRGYRVTKDMPIAHKTLAQIRRMAEDSPMLFVVIVRTGRSLPPTGDQKLLPGDKFVAIMPKESFKTFCTLINRKISKMKKIVVSGDTLTAIHLAEALKPLCEQVILTDPDLEHGRIAASMLHGVEVFHLDSTKSDMLEEMNIKHVDCFIAAGKYPEDNVMSCLLAKVEGAGMAIALRDDKRYDTLFTSLGMDHIIYPQEITLNAIIEKIQMGSLGTHLQLKTADIEVMRAKAGKDSPVTGKSLQQLDKFFKKSIIVGCIIQGNSVIIPRGDTVIQENDEVMVLTPKKNINLVNKAFDLGNGA